MIKIILKTDRDYSVRHFHPWIFSGAIASVDGTPAPGETVTVCADDMSVLGFGAWSGESQIRVRMWTHDADSLIDADFFSKRLTDAISARVTLRDTAVTNALRIVNAEADRLPGVIIDRYADWYVCQFTTTGAEFWKKTIVESLLKLWPAKGVFERSDADVRKHEGLDSSIGLLAGEEPPDTIEIFENNRRYLVDVRNGHKTGFYLDQRDNRTTIAPFAKGGDMLNVFSYTGGFGIAGLVAGAKSVTHVDLSAPALALAKRNTELNGPSVGTSTFTEGNAFEVLRSFRDSRQTFDMIVLDPPKFADAKRHLMGACRGYKDINLLAMKLLRPGGYLATFSCSGLVTQDIFHKVVSEAAVDSGREFQIIHHLQQAADHPEGLCFPEGLYLKGLLCRVNS